VSKLAVRAPKASQDDSLQHQNQNFGDNKLAAAFDKLMISSKTASNAVKTKRSQEVEEGSTKSQLDRDKKWDLLIKIASMANKNIVRTVKQKVLHNYRSAFCK